MRHISILFLGMLHHYLSRGLFRRIQILRGSNDKTISEYELRKEAENLQNIQRYALKFWKENPHYDSLTANYKREPELLAKEAEEIKTIFDIP